MSRHLFLAPTETVARWREAFPDAVVSTVVESLPTLCASDTVWLSAALSDWRRLLEVILSGPARPAVVVLSLQPTQHEALLALDGGARGYCHAFATPAQLREVAVVVSHGGMWVGPDLMGRLIGALRQTAPADEAISTDTAEVVLARLSPREREVASAVSAGHTNKEIARLLGITERTVKAHLGTVFEKLGVRDRLQLALRISG